MVHLLTATWSLWPAVAVLCVAAAVIAIFGARLAGVVDQLADRTGIGEAIAGAVLLGATTSIPGLVVTMATAAADRPSLAFTNGLGGIAIQTTFIVAADLAHRRANLEHAAASITNIANSVLILTLLGVVLIGVTTPSVTILNIHPASFLLVVVYGYGLRLNRRISGDPMWEPIQTKDTVVDEPESSSFEESWKTIWIRFALLAAVVAVSGYLVARAGISIVAATDLSETLVGTFFTSVSTSLPELVTAVAAVRAGALTLAVGGIVGGNTFDVLFVAAADGMYREGSIYAAVARADLFVLGWTMLLVGIVTAGLLRRERRGIGFEGYAVFGLYLAGLAVVLFRGA